MENRFFHLGCGLLLSVGVVILPPKVLAQEYFYNLPLPRIQERGVVSASLGFGSRSQRIYGFRGWEERVALRYPLGDSLVFLGETGIATEERSPRLYLLGGGRWDLSPWVPLPSALSVGLLREYGGVIALESRLITGIRGERSEFLVNLVGEKAFASGRDPLDVHLRAAYSFALSPLLSVGIEYVGDDLEALWEPEEAEGGTRHFFGPLGKIKGGPGGSQVALEPGVELHFPEPGDPEGASPRAGVLFRAGLFFEF